MKDLKLKYIDISQFEKEVYPYSVSYTHLAFIKLLLSGNCKK